MFSIENMKDVSCSHGKTGRDSFSCLFLPSFVVLHMMHFLGTIQALSLIEISPVVLKWDSAEAPCKSCSLPTHQHELVTSHQVSMCRDKAPWSEWSHLFLYLWFKPDSYKLSLFPYIYLLCMAEERSGNVWENHMTTLVIKDTIMLWFSRPLHYSLPGLSSLVFLKYFQSFKIPLLEISIIQILNINYIWERKELLSQCL